jgi:hypothetical protein
VPVSRVAAGTGVSWHTAHDAFAGVLPTRVSRSPTPPPAPALTPRPAPGPALRPTPVRAAVLLGDGPAGRPRRWVSGRLPPVQVLGIDDHRRGKPRYHRDRATGAWVADADRWQTVFVDAAGGHGLLGQAEGRAKTDVTDWLAAQDPAWRAGVRYVGIDMSTV